MRRGCPLVPSHDGLTVVELRCHAPSVGRFVHGVVVVAGSPVRGLVSRVDRWRPAERTRTWRSVAVWFTA